MGVTKSLTALVALLLLGCAVSQDSPAPPLDKQQVRDALVETACDYVDSDGDEDTEAFFKGVREKHGVFNFTENDGHAAGADYRNSKSITCFNKCPNATVDDIVWCVNVFSLQWNVEVCLNQTWSNASSVAAIAEISQHFTVQESCRFGVEACLHVNNAQFYLNNAYLTCTSETASCSRKTFIHFRVETRIFDTEPPRLSVKSHYDLAVGQTNILECTGYFHSVFGFLGWRRSDMEDTYTSINQDPFCNSTVEDCLEDAPNRHLTRERVRVYTTKISETTECTITEVELRSWLFINDTTEEDATGYECVGTVQVLKPFPQLFTSTEPVNTTAVLPPVPTLLEQFPEESLFEVLAGEDAEWNCTVTASSMAMLVWDHNGTPIASTADGCSDLNSEDEREIFVSFTTESLGKYVSRHSAVLHLCGASQDSAGSFQCTILNGTANALGLFRVSVTTKEDGIRPYILAPVLAVGALLVILVVTATAMLILHSHKRRRRLSKMPELTKVNPLFGLELDSHFGGVLTKEKLEKAKLMSTDTMEFPRSKLQLLHHRVLGEGKFGRVILAKADGIVKSAPRRNTVAVKTLKDTSSREDQADLWDELMLMKNMKPHENILNILGHSTTAGGPPYLILEYAVYGSLKDFLKHCEQAVLSLNHAPQIVRSRSRSRRLESHSSVSSAYPLLVETSPQYDSAFSPNTFQFPPPFLSTQDSGFCEDSEDTLSAYAPGMGLPLAHTMCPISHDYINTKGLIYMEDIPNFALQIACGLEHLENMQIVHCDLAARNILIAEGFMLKIADFGMAKSVAENDYYRKSSRHPVPVKWTAPEALENYLFTYKSDVWSFGVVLWEIFTYGHNPYPDINIPYDSWKSFITYLMEGKRLPKPDGCSDFFYDIMLQCWNTDPDRRPSASDMIATLTPWPNSPSAIHTPL